MLFSKEAKRIVLTSYDFSDQSFYYLRQGGYVIVVVCLSVCLFLSVKAKLHYASWFGASSELAPNMFGASSELASVMEFGFWQLCAKISERICMTF